MIKCSLTKAERAELLIQHKKERDKRVADRIKVVLLYDDGWNSEQIEKALFIDDATVRRYLETYLAEKRLHPNHKGSEPLLSPQESLSLSQHLEDHLYAKIKDIQGYIRMTFTKELAVSTLHYWLKKNGFTYKKPKLVPANANPEAQEAFIAQYSQIMNEASIEGDPVLFGDSVHPSQQTRVSYGWVKKGKEKLVETHAGRKRVNIMAVLNLETMGIVYQDYETIDSAATIAFIDKIEAAYPTSKKIHVILDNAGYHTAAAVMKRLETSRVVVHFLPPRSPNLNAIERLWKVMHEYVSNNKCYKKFQDFKKALFWFFDSTIPSIVPELVSRITDNFRVIQCAK